MFFITNRVPKEGLKTEVDRSVSFDPQIVTAAQDVFFCERTNNINNSYVERGKDKFFSTLKNCTHEQILLFIHGFNNTVEDALEKAIDLHQLLKPKVKVLVVPLIWPCDDDASHAILGDYYDDQVAACASKVAFARVLGKFYGWRDQQKEFCGKRINLLAHSMGNRVLSKALEYWVHHYSPRKQIPLLFRNIFMVAADVPNQVLEAGEEGQYIPQSARNTVIYYAHDDFMLAASKFVNIKHHEWGRRLGSTGPEDMNKVPKNVYEVDCDNFNNKFDPPKGHTYFLDEDVNLDRVSPIINHVATALKTGRIDPSNRSQRLDLL